MEKRLEEERVEQIKQAIPGVFETPEMQELIAQTVARVLDKPGFQAKIDEWVQWIKDTLTPEELEKLRAMSPKEFSEQLPVMMRAHEQRSSNSG